MKKQNTPLGGGLWLLVALALPVQQVAALELPIRISVNFILNGSGNRPATGDINTDAEVNAQVDRGNEILKENGMEFRFQLLGINEISGQSAFYNLSASGNSGANRDAIRNAAMADPADWNWRTDAINMYINGGTGSAISKFPPDNDIVFFNQNIFDPTLMHEVGHSVNLFHTHQSPSDECSDTLPDDSDWTRDEIAQNSYGLDYVNCSAAQQALVDNTWENLMSYHDSDNRHIITPQQGNRVSAQTYTDRNWMLSDTPVYVRVGAPTLPFIDMGSWTFPYPSVQAAIDAGEANNRTLVLMNSSSHPDPSSVIDSNTDLITRRGSSVIQDRPPEYELRHDLENSTNNVVASTVLQAQNLSKNGDEAGSLDALNRAAGLAKGKERHALLIEIGDRMKAREEFDEAEACYNLAAAESEQPGLKKRFGKKAKKMKVLKAKKLERMNRDKDIVPGAEEEQP